MVTARDARRIPAARRASLLLALAPLAFGLLPAVLEPILYLLPVDEDLGRVPGLGIVEARNHGQAVRAQRRRALVGLEGGLKDRQLLRVEAKAMRALRNVHAHGLRDALAVGRG